MAPSDKKPSPNKGGGATPVVGSSLEMKRKGEIENFANNCKVGAFAPLKPHVLKHAALGAKGLVFMELTVLPLIFQLGAMSFEAWNRLQPHLQGENMKDIVPAFVGLILCLFGGTFPLVIAAVEAFRLCGWGSMKVALQDLYSEGEKAMDAHKKDESENSTSDNGDTQQVMARKMLILLRVVDPNKCQTALNSLLAGCLAVLASLKLTFARAVTLGAALGDVLKNALTVKVLPKVNTMVPEEYQKWIPPLCDYLCKFIAMSIALCMQTVISAIHSAIRGGQMFGQGVVRYLHRTGKIDFNEDESLLDEAAGYVAAAVGLMWQISSGFDVTFPFSLLLLPCSISETVLGTAIAWV